MRARYTWRERGQVSLEAWTLRRDGYDRPSAERKLRMLFPQKRFHALITYLVRHYYNEAAA